MQKILNRVAVVLAGAVTTGIVAGSFAATETPAPAAAALADAPTTQAAKDVTPKTTRRNEKQKATRRTPAATLPATVPGTWKQVPWSRAFTAVSHRLEHAPSNDAGGHPLDTVMDRTGAPWTVGEFSMALTRGTTGGDVERVNLPLKQYTTGGKFTGWTKPFSSTWGGTSSSSEIGESIVDAGHSIWTGFGGQQAREAGTNNHSLLMRVDVNDPTNVCVVPLPGYNNEVIGLAYDSVRDRIWFVEGEGDHLRAGNYSTLGWVKATGLDGNCLNDLDYGGNPALTEAQDARVQAAASRRINALACTRAQEQSGTGNCVHHATSDLAPGGTHLVYDQEDDVMWINNWADRNGILSSFDPATGRVTTYPAPPANLDLPIIWQIAVDGDAVYVNEYEGNRILRMNKTTGTWSALNVPTGLVADNPGAVETHSIAISGRQMWFTISDEDYSERSTALGYVNLDDWAAGKASGTIFTGWNTLPMAADAPAKNAHSLRGLDVIGDRIAVTDHGDMATVVLTRK